MIDVPALENLLLDLVERDFGPEAAREIDRRPVLEILREALYQDAPTHAEKQRAEALAAGTPLRSTDVLLSLRIERAMAAALLEVARQLGTTETPTSPRFVVLDRTLDENSDVLERSISRTMATPPPGEDARPAVILTRRGGLDRLSALPGSTLR